MKRNHKLRWYNKSTLLYHPFLLLYHYYVEIVILKPIKDPRFLGLCYKSENSRSHCTFGCTTLKYSSEILKLLLYQKENSWLHCTFGCATLKYSLVIVKAHVMAGGHVFLCSFQSLSFQGLVYGTT